MQLKTYLKRSGLTTSDFAVEARLSQGEVSKIANGRKVPSDLSIAKIAVATKGAVGAKDFSTLKRVKEVPFQ